MIRLYLYVVEVVNPAIALISLVVRPVQLYSIALYQK